MTSRPQSRWMPLTRNCWFSQPWVNTSLQRGAAGWRDRGKEAQWCWTITWGLSFWGGGKQESDARVIQRPKSQRCVPTDVGVDHCDYYVVGGCLQDCNISAHECIGSDLKLFYLWKNEHFWKSSLTSNSWEDYAAGMIWEAWRSLNVCFCCDSWSSLGFIVTVVAFKHAQKLRFAEAPLHPPFTSALSLSHVLLGPVLRMCCQVSTLTFSSVNFQPGSAAKSPSAAVCATVLLSRLHSFSTLLQAPP